MSSTLLVRFGEQVVATIHGGNDRPVLRYDRRWLAMPGSFPVSFSLPLRSADHGVRRTRAWLGSLLPQGALLNALATALGIPPDDHWAILARVGGDLPGAFSIVDARLTSSPAYRVIETEWELEALIDSLEDRPFLAGQPQISMALSGRHNGLPVAFVDRKIAIPLNGAVSTHILRPDTPGSPDRLTNEALCLELARKIALPVPRMTSGFAGSRRYLLIERSDRKHRFQSRSRVHQESFGQVLGLSPIGERHDVLNVGPQGALEAMLQFARAHLDDHQLGCLTNLIIFNVAIGNLSVDVSDYGLMPTPEMLKIAPCRSLCAEIAQTARPQNMALPLAGERDPLALKRQHWQELFAHAGWPPRIVAFRVERLNSRLLAKLLGAIRRVRDMPGMTGSAGEIGAAIGQWASQIQANARM